MGYKDSVERAGDADTSRQSVDGESLVSRKKMTTAEEVEDNLIQTRKVKSEVCGSLGMWWNYGNKKRTLAVWGADPGTGQMKILMVRKEKAPAARGADPSTGHKQINAINL